MNNNSTGKKYNTRLSLELYIIIFIFSGIFIALFSLWTSPLYKDWYGCDASFFTMAGRGILNGWVPYVDFFDLKGPYFFFIEALGQFFFYGRTGAFLIQIFAFFFALVLIMKLCLLFIDYKKTLFVLLVFCFSHIATLWGGNTLEEFLLPLSLLCLFLTAKNYMENETFKLKWYTPFICGISFAIFLFSKVSVAGPVAGIVLASLIIFILNKDIKSLLLYILFGILGIIVGCLPIFIFFGLHNSIPKMLYCVFVIGFKRSVDYGQALDLKWELKISGCYFALLFSILQIKKLNDERKEALKCASNEELDCESKEELDCESNEALDCESDNKQSHNSRQLNFHIIIVCMALITALALHLGTPYIYYFTTSYSVLLFALIILFYVHNPMVLFKEWRIDIPLLLFLICMCYFGSWTGNTLSTVLYERDSEYYGKYVNDALEMGSFIPEADRNSVFSFNTDMQWFEINEILPCYKYQINLPYFASIDPKIEPEILEYLKNTPPKWLVVGDDLDSALPAIDSYILDNYSFIYSNDYGALYLKN